MEGIAFLDSLPEYKKKALSLKMAEWVVSVFYTDNKFHTMVCFGTFFQLYNSYFVLFSSAPKQRDILALANLAIKAETDFSIHTSDYAKEEMEFLEKINWNVIFPTAERYIFLLCPDRNMRKVCYVLIFLRFIYNEFSPFTEKEIARSAYYSLIGEHALTINEQKCAVLFAQKCNLKIPSKYERLTAYLENLKCPEIKEYSDRMISPLAQKREPMSVPSSEYTVSKRIGMGAYSKVFSGSASASASESASATEESSVAVKIYTSPINYEGVNSAVLKEISFFKILSHPNILSLVDVATVKKNTSIVLKKYDTTLKNYAFENILSIKQIQKICTLVLRGIEYLHSRNIVHRDIKSENIFLKLHNNNITELVIADFGFMIMLNDVRPSSIICTPNYRPPEIFFAGNQYYNGAVDMWSVGCVFAELFINKYLFYDKHTVNTEEKILTAIFNFVSPPNQEIYKKFYEKTRKKEDLPLFQKAIEEADGSKPCVIPNIAGEFLLSFLNIDPDKRITAKEALAHPFLKSSLN